MNKELTPLERLKTIKSTWNCMNPNCSEAQEEDFNIIETALKALEIIKSKGVAVGMLQLEEVGLKEYNDFIGDKKLYLTEEQFNLLKEVLL